MLTILLYSEHASQNGYSDSRYRVWYSYIRVHVCIQISIGSNCPGISGTILDYKNLSRVPERYVKCPRKVLTYVLRQENRKGSLAIEQLQLRHENT